MKLPREIRDKDIAGFVKFLRIRNKKAITSIAVVEKFIDRISDDHIFLISAGIAFNILVYLIPLVLVALYVINLWVGADKVLLLLIDVLQKVLPPNYSTINVMQTTVKEVIFIFSKSSLLGWIGIVTLIWLSSTLFSSIRTGLNHAFKIPTPKTYFFYKIKDIALIFILAVMILISTYFFPIVSYGQKLLLNFVPASELSIGYSKFIITLFSLSTSFILFGLIFRFVPNKRIPRFTRYFSIFTCIIFVEVSRNLFGWYLSSISNYGRFYGAYTLLASLAVWVYYLVFIMIFSAELGQYIEDLKEGESNSTIVNE